jgi:hydrogenase maturation protease
MKKKTVVLGLGNPLMADEGVGTHIIERLSAKTQEFSDVDFIDAGTGGMNVLHLIEGREKAAIIDCAFMGTTAGTIKRFGLDDVRSVKKLAHYSLHETDIIKIIEIARQLGQCPQEIVIFGIEPECVKMQPNLSKKLMSLMDDYVGQIIKELAV